MKRLIISRNPSTQVVKLMEILDQGKTRFGYHSQLIEPPGEGKLVPKIERIKTDKVNCLSYSNSWSFE